MATPYLEKALVNLRATINKRWPKRDKESDGWIGDTSHQARKSDHNPDYSAGAVVRAIDVDDDGIHTKTVVASAMAHYAVQYVIFNRKIYSRTYGFKPRAYTGSDPHTNHIHVSGRHGSKYETSPNVFHAIVGNPSWVVKAGEKENVRVRLVQAFLNAHGAALVVDGEFSASTARALKAFQRKHGLKPDGVVGPKTWTVFRTK